MAAGSGKKFFPDYLFEIAVVVLFTAEAVFILAVVSPQPIGREIDFSAQYSPRPEWYFLFLYELTKYFPGKWTFVGAVVIPLCAFSVVLLAPFLDSSKAASLRDRKGAAIAGFSLLLGVIMLTLLSQL